jgi:teichuronic acid biosynthesis glycosyltransferase TuaC
MGAMPAAKFVERTAAGGTPRADSMARLRVLCVTTLFPSSANPRHGIFVETRLCELRKHAPLDVRVVAPVPWFPIAWSPGRYAAFAATPRFEVRNGVEVRHPRYVVIPRVGMALQPLALAAACLRAVQQLGAGGWSCDVIDAHYLYPDGVAAAELARRLDRPLVVTARGSDVNLIAQMPGPRRRILAALEQAHSVIAVSAALKRAMVQLGVPAEKIDVLRNGVDSSMFRPGPREAVRNQLGVGDAPLVASVGNLVLEKGHDLVLAAVARLPNAHVVIVGRGPERERLARQAQQLGIHERVRFIDNMSQAELVNVYNAADLLALGSTREGWPNVVLEAMACGTPVVASDVGGVSEMVNEAVGEVVATREVAPFAAALLRVLRQPPGRDAVRAHAERFSWDPVVSQYFDIMTDAAHASARRMRALPMRTTS